MPPTISTSATLSGAPSPSNFEQQVTFTVVITAASFSVAPPSGTVNFYDGASLIGSVTVVPVGPTSTMSVGTFQVTILLAGTHDISAQYLGDSTYIGTTATPNPFVQQVNTVVAAANQLPGFALIASYSATGDSDLPPQALLYAVPSTSPPSQSITLLWDTVNVGQIEITGNNHVDYQAPPPPGSVLGFDTGRISVTGSGVYVVGNGFTASILLTLTAYDNTGHPLGLTSTVQITIS